MSVGLPVRTIREVVVSIEALRSDPNYRHPCRRCGRVFWDDRYLGLVTPLDEEHLPLPFLRRFCEECA